MRRLLEALTVFDWVTPSVGLVDDVVNPGAHFLMDSKNYDKACAALEGFDFHGEHLAGGGSTYAIKVDKKHERAVKRKLGMAGVRWK